MRGPAIAAVLVVASAGCGGLLATDDVPGEAGSDASSLEASTDSTFSSPDGDDATEPADSTSEASPSSEASADAGETDDTGDASDAAVGSDVGDAGDVSDVRDSAVDSSATDATQPHPFCDDACALGDQECDPLPQICTYDDAGHTIGCQSQGEGVWTCVMGNTGCTVWANGVACASDVPCCDTCQQGTCPLGSIGEPCRQDTDCASNACDAASHVCVDRQCADHRQDGAESDVDCGGPVCDACVGGQRCRNSLDCEAGHPCSAGSTRVCEGPFVDASAGDAAACADECMVGDQQCSDLPQVCTYDDAGFTASCDAPGEGVWTCVSGGAGCAVWAPGTACGSGACCAGCQRVACDAGSGPLCWSCPPGADGAPCEQDPDCTSDACDAVGHACVSSQCADHRQDGQETDVDCGGPVCPACGSTQSCQTNRDCQPGHICLDNGYGKNCT